ncbi:MAG TPA: DMT family transporter [Planctomycetota bacterium]|nr:DMT family transporter [Planctomycetota bacterium]
MKKAALVLVFCCIFWGYSFPVMQLAMTQLRGQFALRQGALPTVAQNVGLSAAFLGWRFGLATLCSLVLLKSARQKYSSDDLRIGALLGVLFGVGMLHQLAGLQYTLPSASSFLTSLGVIFTPVAQALIFRRAVHGWTWAGVGLALIGAAILALPNPDACASCTIMETPPIRYLGEYLTASSAVFFSAQTLALDRFGSRCNPERMTVAMFATAALIFLALSAGLCGRSLYNEEILKTLAGDVKFSLFLLSLTLLSSVLAINLMNRYQKYVSPAVASVIYSNESVFATGFSCAIFFTEKLTWTTALGGALILAALAAVTLPKSEATE